jgi:hypothetical protein
MPENPIAGEDRMTAKIDLSDLFELFATTEEKPLVEPPVSSEARRWRRVFEDNVAAILRVRSISRAEAAEVAFANTVTAFLNAAHPKTDPNRCAHCARPETPGATLLPIGWGERHTWLHDDCWAAWREARRNAVIAELATVGVTRP